MNNEKADGWCRGHLRQEEHEQGLMQVGVGVKVGE
jgi:hypothetical protein